MRRSVTAVVCVSAAAWCLSLSAQAADAKTLFEKHVYKGAEGRELNYRLLVPEKVEAGRKYPLVLFLHGAGERGADNTAQLVHGMHDFCKAENRAKYPCYVLAPQCPAEKKWVEVDWSADRHDQPQAPSDALGLTLDLIKAWLAPESKYAIDPQRIYVTGLSMGGYGTWDAAARHPELFAAAAPICGGGDEKTADKLVKMPLWAFHGDKDGAVKVERTRRMIAAIKKAGGEPKYTEYAGVGHNSWSQTYADPQFFEWLFAQKRPAPAPSK